MKHYTHLDFGYKKLGHVYEHDIALLRLRESIKQAYFGILQLYFERQDIGIPLIALRMGSIKQNQFEFPLSLQMAEFREITRLKTAEDFKFETCSEATICTKVIYSN